ncbi:MAG: stage II sporulation protein R [Oscillospiraceae bacterium]|nr:stage II sporulation protein R [Oscillospiraceae bacterium]
MVNHKKSLCIALSLALLVAVFASVGSFFAQAKDVRGQVLRLHVLANSDSEEDQALKLHVRDALLAAGGALFDGSTTVADAREKLMENHAALQEAGEAVIRASGQSYPLTIEVTEDYFDTRSYGEVTLPAGRYVALRAVIGAGAGHNWWCVMFPPLCLPAAEAQPEEYFDTDTLALVESDPKIEVRFKLLEWAENLRERWARAMNN